MRETILIIIIASGMYVLIATMMGILRNLNKLKKEHLTVMTYQELVKEAEKLYYDVAQDSPFCAGIMCRELIASKIDQCSDREEHLGILKWEEYKKFAPMTKKEYQERLEQAKRKYEDNIAQINKDWEERGKFSPDYHKI